MDKMCSADGSYRVSHKSRGVCPQSKIKVPTTFEIPGVEHETHVACNALVSACDVRGQIVAIPGGTSVLPKETRDTTRSGLRIP
ncbi:hypothetical protein AWB71_02963 [Caballeronia peredens]|nr:hypothetical protein AWB71_02963 [Caballeronia peredens]